MKTMSTRAGRIQQGLWAPAIALVVVQVVHGAIPGPGEKGGPPVGLIVGAIFLIASVAVLLGLNARRAWARPLLAATGAAVAVGFLLYHAIPVKTPLSYPYWGHGQASAGVGQWAPVIAAIAVGVWCALAATERAPRLSRSS